MRTMATAFGIGRNNFMGEKLTPAQSRAARGLLDWSQTKLAEKADVSISSVNTFERNRRGVSEEIIRAMRIALETAGVKFNEGVMLFGRPRK